MKWVKKKQAKGCLFCNIAKGDKKTPSEILYNDGKFMVLMNIFPYNTGHLQVLPVKHVAAIEDLDDKDVSAMFILVKKCVKLLKKVLQPLGFNIGINQGGDVAGASVEHLHIHIVPRFRRDLGFIDLISSTKVLPEPVGETYKKLKRHAKILE
jgi:diadenosine tetraphosphate (Ap4A) HIT family hydrolase